MSASRTKPQNRRRAAVSIRDVARRARVSIATVSRAVNRVSTVDPELAKRVWKAAEETG
jgi:LacI family transcriptional regulator